MTNDVYFIPMSFNVFYCIFVMLYVLMIQKKFLICILCTQCQGDLVAAIVILEVFCLCSGTSSTFVASLFCLFVCLFHFERIVPKRSYLTESAASQLVCQTVGMSLWLFVCFLFFFPPAAETVHKENKTMTFWEKQYQNEIRSHRFSTVDIHRWIPAMRRSSFSSVQFSPVL